MKKRLLSLSIGLSAMVLLPACQPQNDSTQKELASLKEQLAQQQQREAERSAKELEQRQAEQIESARKEGYQEAQDDLHYKQMLEEEEKKFQEQEAAKAAEQQKARSAKVSERLARYPAFVISESGWGQLNLRGAPNARSVVVTELNDGDQVMVVGETNVCTPKGCWVKVQVNGMTGYVNGAFLQRGTAPKKMEEGIY